MVNNIATHVTKLEFTLFRKLPDDLIFVLNMHLVMEHIHNVLGSKI